MPDYWNNQLLISDFSPTFLSGNLRTKLEGLGMKCGCTARTTHHGSFISRQNYHGFFLYLICEQGWTKCWGWNWFRGVRSASVQTTALGTDRQEHKYTDGAITLARVSSKIFLLPGQRENWGVLPTSEGFGGVPARYVQLQGQPAYPVVFIYWII